MGQKVSPIGFRVGVTRDWDSKWYSARDYSSYMLQDIKIRQYITSAMAQAKVSKVVIERPTKERLILTIHVGHPGIVIGKQGAGIEKAKADLHKETLSEITLNIVEIRKPEADATLIAQSIAQQLEKRISYRRAMKQAIQKAQKAGVQGVKIDCSGRLGGAEIARTEGYREGRVPLHTLKANIDQGFAEANTVYGKIGIKVLIYHGDV